jgi:ribosomal protein L2
MRKESGPQDVVRIEYDPGRSAHIALLRSRNPNANGGQPWTYILAPEGLRAGDVVTSYRTGIPDGLVEGYVDDPKKEKVGDSEMDNEESSESALSFGILRSVTIKLGNVLPLRLIPPGTIIHNLTLDPNGKAKLVRSAGTFATMMQQEEKGKYAQASFYSIHYAEGCTHHNFIGSPPVRRDTSRTNRLLRYYWESQ